MMHSKRMKQKIMDSKKPLFLIRMNTRVFMKCIFNPIRPYWFLVSAAFLMVMLTGNVYGQKEDKIKAILKASDSKKIEKTDGYKEVADKLMEEANQLYKETIAVKGSTEFDEKGKKKKVKQLEGQARQKITAASDLYRERNGTKYRLYKTYMEKFWLQFEGDEASYDNAKTIEEQSNDLYYQAVTNRTEANKMPDGHEKIQKLKQAIESENLAIDRQLTVLGLYYGIDLKEKEAEKDIPVEILQPAAMEETIIEPDAGQNQPAVQQTTDIQPVEQKESGIAQQPVTTVQDPVKEQTPEEQIAAVETASQPQQTPSEVVFRIQLAASRTPLTKEKVAKLCSKPYPIDRTEENGWYKYYIATGNSYEHAKKVLNECGAVNAFIVPYKNGRRITLSEATQKTP
jgi:hypothetical protein